MRSVHDQIREHLLAGSWSILLGKVPDLESLKVSEWSTEFEQYMRNRLIMGAMRYGLLKTKNKLRYNRVDSIRQRLDLYNETGNAEHLVDIANLCLLEFEEPNHKNFHFKSIDDDIHTKRK